MTEAVRDDELNGLFAPLLSYDVCIVAVSGGSDSTALMHLAARWKAALAGEGPELVIAAVDHGLRATSAREASGVARAAAQLGLACRVLRWEGPKPATRVQEAAREARYRLLIAVAKATGAARVAIVTAHTREDQAETVLMRLARGSGLDGLSGIAPVRAIEAAPGIEIVRPLLGVSKSRLAATLHERGIAWIEDPSNECLAFERVRVRRASVVLAEIGLTSEPIALSAHRLQRVRAALEAATAGLVDAAVRPNAGAYASIDRRQFDAAPEEIQLRLLGVVIGRFGGGARAPSLAQLEALHAEIGAAGSKGVTLGGTLIVSGDGAIRVFREAGRRGLPVVGVKPGQHVLWDNRFLVGLDRSAQEGIEVRPLGGKVYATLRRDLKAADILPARAGATLPSLWAGGALVTVPHLVGSIGDGEPPGHGLCIATAGGWADSHCSVEFIW